MRYPCSPFIKVGGIVFFARMLDKIRLQAANELPPEYVPYMTKGGNLRLCTYLHIDYPKLVERVLQGGTDEEILEWAYQNGKRLNDVEILVWNGYSVKRGLRDEVSEPLVQFKKDSGLSHRDDLDTIFEYFEVDEKRKP
jgi:gluconokinase